MSWEKYTQRWNASTSEAELQEKVRQAAVQLGILYYHTHNSRRSPAGFPDLVLVRPPNCLFRELKSQTGKLTADQSAWLDSLAACDQDAGVWRPSDWLEGTIQRELAEMRNPA